MLLPFSADECFDFVLGPASVASGLLLTQVLLRPLLESHLDCSQMYSPASSLGKKGYIVIIYFLTTESSEKARVFSLHYYNIYTDGNRTGYLMNESPSVFQLSYFNLVKGYGNLPAQLSSCQKLRDEGLQALKAKFRFLLELGKGGLRVVTEEGGHRSWEKQV